MSQQRGAINTRADAAAAAGGATREEGSGEALGGTRIHTCFEKLSERREPELVITRCSPDA